MDALLNMSQGTLLGIFAVILFVVEGSFVTILIGKNEELKEAKNSVNKLNRSFNELDEQAKIIVKTDLELNKAQEEIDKRLSDLNMLQKAHN